MFNLQHCLVVATRYEHTNALHKCICIYSDSQGSGDSLVESMAVDRRVVGSNPALAAT